jgi:hypothetical protein
MTNFVSKRAKLQYYIGVAYARMQISSGEITMSDIMSMTCVRRELYLEAVDSLVDEPYGTIPGEFDELPEDGIIH